MIKILRNSFLDFDSLNRKSKSKTGRDCRDRQLVVGVRGEERGAAEAG